MKLTTEKFIERSKIVHGNKYDYSQTEYKSAHEKVKIICPTHGVFEQKAWGHLNGKGCPECARKKPWTTETFVKKAKEIHGDKYDYSKTHINGILNKVIITCPIHGIFEQQPRAHLYGQGCAKCKTSRGENVINEWFKNNFDIKKLLENLNLVIAKI